MDVQLTNQINDFEHRKLGNQIKTGVNIFCALAALTGVGLLFAYGLGASSGIGIAGGVTLGAAVNIKILEAHTNEIDDLDPTDQELYKEWLKNRQVFEQADKVGKLTIDNFQKPSSTAPLEA